MDEHLGINILTLEHLQVLQSSVQTLPASSIHCLNTLWTMLWGVGWGGGWLQVCGLEASPYKHTPDGILKYQATVWHWTVGGNKSIHITGREHVKHPIDRKQSWDLNCHPWVKSHFMFFRIKLIKSSYGQFLRNFTTITMRNITVIHLIIDLIVINLESGQFITNYLH